MKKQSKISLASELEMWAKRNVRIQLITSSFSTFFPVFVFQPKNGKLQKHFKIGVYFSYAESIGGGKVLPVTLLS